MFICVFCSTSLQCLHRACCCCQPALQLTFYGCFVFPSVLLPNSLTLTAHAATAAVHHQATTGKCQGLSAQQQQQMTSLCQLIAGQQAQQQAQQPLPATGPTHRARLRVLLVLEKQQA
jgi:hypothetical protein